MPNGGWDHFTGNTYSVEHGNGSDPDYIQRLGEGCELCCFQRPLAVQTWSWTKLKPTPVTVGTAIIVIDPKSNRTSTSTVIHTTSIVVNGGAYQPSQWITNGTYYSPSLTAPRTTSFIDLDGNKRRLVYPTQTTHIQSYLNWIGKVPITQNGTTTCLVNDGARSPIPLPTNTPLPVSGIADPADPNGVWWALASDNPVPSLGGDEVDAYFAGRLFQSVADSCVAAWPLAPETAVALGSFLLQTSTSYGAVPTPSLGTTSEASVAVPAATLWSQALETTALVDPLAGEGSASTATNLPERPTAGTSSPTISQALETLISGQSSKAALPLSAVQSSRPANAAAPTFTYSPLVSEPTNTVTAASTTEVSTPAAPSSGYAQDATVASSQSRSVQTVPILSGASSAEPATPPPTSVQDTMHAPTTTAEALETSGDTRPTQSSIETPTGPSPSLPADMGTLIVSVLVGGGSHPESPEPASPTNALQVLTEALQSAETLQSPKALSCTGATSGAILTTLPQYNLPTAGAASTTPPSSILISKPSIIQSSNAVILGTALRSSLMTAPDGALSTLPGAPATTLITDSTLQSHEIPSRSESLPRVTVAPVSITLAPFTIGLQTLLPGSPAVTVNGTTYSLATASSATGVVVNGQTSMVRTSEGSEPSVGAVATTSTYEGDADSLKQLSRRRYIEVTMGVLCLVAWQYLM
ncbi:hypothetical protein LTR95_015491 [Oleoguttula sp. CCFEE 5521]